MNDEAEAALLALPLYRHAQRLVEVRPLAKSDIVWINRPEGLPSIAPLLIARVTEALSHAAAWLKWNSRSKSWAPTRPDPHTAAAILARAGHGFPPLVAVVETPYLLPNLTLHATPGYCRETGILYMGNFVAGVPDAPTKIDAQAAFDILAEPFCDFRFVSSADLAAAVAAVLTVIQRNMIAGPCPMFAARGNTRGVGKGLLCDTIATIATGRHASKIPTTDDEEEWRKRLLSIALDGSPVVCVDNVKESIGSTALAMALTECQVVDRILGESRQVRASLSCTWFSTGNNTGFKGDLGRRVIPMDQEADTATPEDRVDFRHGHGSELLRWCLDHREALVSAALTIIKAHVLAGKPGIPGHGPLGSFEEWDRAVRQPIHFASAIDPCDTRIRLRHAGDEDEEPIRALYGALAEVMGVNDAFTAPQAVARSESNPLLRDALGLFCLKADKPEPRAVSKALGKFVGRIADGRKLVRESVNSTAGLARYRLQPIA